MTKKKLDTPIKTDDGEITEGVDTITWTAESDADAIPPGAFQDFGLSVQIPGQGRRHADLQGAADLHRRRGRALDRRRGLRQPGPDRHRVTAEAHSGSPTATPAADQPVATGRIVRHGRRVGNGLAIVALIVGALGLIVGAAALALAAPRGRSAV